MKHVRKIASLLLALVMVFALATTAAAAEDYKITVTNSIKDETYTAYKVFDVVYSGDNYSYTIDSGSAFYDTVSAFAATASNGITLEQVGTTTTYNVVADKDKFTDSVAAALAVQLAEDTSKPSAAGTATGNDSAVEIDVADGGYYFVSTSVGALCSLNTTNPTAEILEKNSIPTGDKKQSATNGSGYADTTLSVNVGDTVYYDVTITDGTGTDKVITVTDIMTNGLKYNKDIAVYTGSVSESTKVTEGDTTYTVSSASDTGFTVTLAADYVKSVGENGTIVLRYSATVTADAVTKSEDGANTNTVKIEYSKQTITDSVEVETLKFQIVKDDSSDKVLTGAKFKLYNAKTAGTEIPVVKVSDGVYRVAVAGETGVEIEAGTPVIRGLKAGTYYLEETVAPTGYNKLDERKEVKLEGDNLASVTDNAYISGGVEVENNSGSVLPSTGGMGTTLFYVFGGILVVAAVVLLVTKKRMNYAD